MYANTVVMLVFILVAVAVLVFKFSLHQFMQLLQKKEYINFAEDSVVFAEVLESLKFFIKTDSVL